MNSKGKREIFMFSNAKKNAMFLNIISLLYGS